MLPNDGNPFISDLASAVEWKFYQGAKMGDADFENAWDALYQQTTKMTKDTCFFTAKEGYVGSGFIDIRRGDSLCILSGCKFPLIVPQGDNGSYRIIDAVHVDCIMNGVSFEHQSGHAVTDFVI
jgi:hypothetical protein